jgi:hypothetical protein
MTGVGLGVRRPEVGRVEAELGWWFALLLFPSVLHLVLRYCDKTPVELFCVFCQKIKALSSLLQPCSHSINAAVARIFLDELSNSHPAVRLYGEGRVTGPPKATGGAEIATDSIDHLMSSNIEMLFTAPAEGKRIATWNGDAT